MKNTKKWIAVIAIAMCTVFMATACATQKPAAKIGETRTVTVASLKNAYTNYESYAGYYGYDVSTDDGRKEYLRYLLNNLVNTQLLAYEAEKKGITLTDAEKEEAKKTGAESYDNYYQQFVEYAEKSGTADVTYYANKYLTESLAAAGMTVSKLKKQFVKDAEDELLITKLEEAEFKKEPTEEQYKEMYDEQLASQTEQMENDPTYYFTQEYLNKYSYGYMPLYTPEGLFYVRNLLVEDEETAKQLKERIDAGEDFDALVEEYSTDPGSKDGGKYVCGEGANFVEEFLNAALALEKEGDVSDIVQSEHGFHIIKRYEDVPSGTLAYEDVEEEFKEFAKNDYQNELYNNALEEWMKEDVTFFPENYESIGA